MGGRGMRLDGLRAGRVPLVAAVGSAWLAVGASSAEAMHPVKMVDFRRPDAKPPTDSRPVRRGPEGVRLDSQAAPSGIDVAVLPGAEPFGRPADPAGMVLEDVVWFRCTTEGFGRCEDWDGVVSLIEYRGPPAEDGEDGAVLWAVGIRCGSQQSDGSLVVRGSGSTPRGSWRPVGLRIEPEVSYRLSARFPLAGGPIELSVIDGRTSHRLDLTGGVAAGMLPPAGGPKLVLRRRWSTAGGPSFATWIARWQLWDVSDAGTVGLAEQGPNRVLRVEPARAIATDGAVRRVPGEGGAEHLSFEPLPGLDETFAHPQGWRVDGRSAGERDAPTLPLVRVRGADDRKTTGQALAAGRLDAVPCGYLRLPAARFTITTRFQIPKAVVGQRQLDLVNLIDPATGRSTGVRVRLAPDYFARGKHKVAGALITGVGTTVGSDVIERTPIEPQQWYELAVEVDPFAMQWTATLGLPNKRWVPLFGNKAFFFEAPVRAGSTMALRFGGSSAYYHGKSRIVTVASSASLAMPKRDDKTPWRRPDYYGDMTLRDGRLEMFNTHGKGNLTRIDVSSSKATETPVPKGVAETLPLCWDPYRRVYWAGASNSRLTQLDASLKPRKLKPPPRHALTSRFRIAADAGGFWATGHPPKALVRGSASDPAGPLQTLPLSASGLPARTVAGLAASDSHVAIVYTAANPQFVVLRADDLRPVLAANVATLSATVTAAAGDARRLWLRTADGKIVGVDWSDRACLSPEEPAVLVGRVRVEPAEAVERLALLPRPDKQVKVSAKPKVVTPGGKDSPPHGLIGATPLACALPPGSVIVGHEPGQVGTLRLKLRLAAPLNGLWVGAVGTGGGQVFFATVSGKAKRRRGPLPEVVAAREFFDGADGNAWYRGRFTVGAATRRRRVAIEPVGRVRLIAPDAWRTAELDLIEDLGLTAGQPLGRVELVAISKAAAHVAEAVLIGRPLPKAPREATLTGPVLDVGGPHRLLDVPIDRQPPGRRGDAVRVAFRSAADRAELPGAAWQRWKPPADGGPLAEMDAAPQLQRYLQWQITLRSGDLHRPMALTGVRLLLRPDAGDDAVAVPPQAGPSQAWKFCVLAIVLAAGVGWAGWFIFFRPRDEPGELRLLSG